MSESARARAEIQRRYFEDADADRFHWTVSAPGFAETEDALLEPLLAHVESPCLELGCGEGNNLTRLSRRARCMGTDLFPRKLRFARRQLPGVGLVAAEASALPFRSGAFSTVFVRDLLHHVPDPASTLAEAVRVLRPGGSLLLLEPNGRNPLVRLQTHLIRAERDARGFDRERIAGWLAAQPVEAIRTEMRQALPLRRLLLHYRFGLPSLGRHPGARRLLARSEEVLGRFLPRSRWSYVTAVARRRAAGSSP
ncbi:MAG: class I SAM-dependent methyltransferase [Myxococcota bacterium]